MMKSHFEEFQKGLEPEDEGMWMDWQLDWESLIACAEEYFAREEE